ncbi:hypothetical protein COMA2_10091 [Candidatus Nitrospira nitrificans]|uniref:Uncharacterized protein n=1 Tax=Candidatus Nitrospira nitrificans TaxID=1742973 RepID=A0A0S4L3S9_9BACT|nr:hypothetical protein COMA2_10091 [Candidatus Nitrospira nitrificans]
MTKDVECDSFLSATRGDYMSADAAYSLMTGLVSSINRCVLGSLPELPA